MLSGNSNVLGNSHVVLDGVVAAAAVALAGSEEEVDDSSVIVLSYLE